jgi:hypothetical protein
MLAGTIRKIHEPDRLPVLCWFFHAWRGGFFGTGVHRYECARCQARKVVMSVDVGLQPSDLV